MMSHDPEGKMGPKQRLPDQIVVHEPKDEAPVPMGDDGYGGYGDGGY